ncbi:SCP2 sterol-binding domain-containing protein [Amycolatopsis suaedae]|uniref:SCP2 sterol-binding domain-containing protein n=1 Tax=Amycolatopsis suaedae TaxID=2510978 RepID=A0A4Q7JD98_9PSEU|nr:SCP2 sterol-binding domain-containing protein [Amycolatopsis suaedae]
MTDIGGLDGPALAEMLRGVDLGEIEPEQFAQLVATVTPAQLKMITDDPQLREIVLGEIFGRMSKHLRQQRARDLNAVIRWRLTGGSGPDGYDRYETIISGGTCTVSREPSDRKPRVTITISPADFIRVITHQATAATLFVTGKIKVKGDLAFAAGLTGYFDLPRAS